VCSSDLHSLGNLPSVLQLELNYCPNLKSVGGHGDLSNLRFLSIWNCHSLDTFTGLADFPNLITLSLGYNDGVTNLNGISVIPSLERLELHDNRRVTSLATLPTFPKLRDLYIHNYSALTDLAGLGASQPQLEKLDIIGCDALTSMHHIGHLGSLKTLTLQDNISFSSFEGMTAPSQLGVVRMIRNDHLLDLSGMEWLTHVEGLLIDDNVRLASLAGLESLATVGGKGVFITGNASLSECVATEFVESIDIEGTVNVVDNQYCISGVNFQTDRSVK